MGLFRRLIDAVSGKVRVSLSSVLRLGAPVWSGRNAKAYAKEGYGSNVIVFRCVDIIAKSLASVPLVVKQGEEIAGPEHPLVKLLERPNPRTTRARLVHQMVAYRLISGNSYLEKLGPENSAPVELWVWAPYNLKPIVNEKSALPVGYGFDDGKHKVGWEVDPISGRSCILHWHTFNPLNPWLGMSPIESMAKSVDQRNSADEWNQALLQHHAEPSGIMTSETSVTDAQINQIRQQIEERYSGPHNAKRPMILGGGLKWNQVALSPKDMDWLEGKNVAGRDIAGAFGVPTQVIPIQGDQTFANYEQARLALWEDTVIPLGRDLVEELNHWFEEDYPGASIHMDLDDIPALAPRRAKLWETANASTFTSTDEKRELVDLPPVEDEQGDGGAILVSAGQITLDDMTSDIGELIPRGSLPEGAGRNRLQGQDKGNGNGTK